MATPTRNQNIRAELNVQDLNEKINLERNQKKCLKTECLNK